MTVLDDASIELPCPHCRQAIKERLGKLKLNPRITCPKCRRTSEVKAEQLQSAANKLTQAFANIQQSLARLGR
jgi:transposase-like protein